jgi:ribosomal-protein-alanine N-acetyltransferase
MIGLFKSLSEAIRGKPIRAGRVYMRPPQRRDCGKWLKIRAGSKDFLQPWEPTWPIDSLTRKAFFRRLKTYAFQSNTDTGYVFLVFGHEDHALIGSIAINDVRRGVAQSCSVGYWVGEQYAGKGYMTEALSGVLPIIFSRLKIHRIEAACLPHNEASLALLIKIGFRREGFVKRYLKINGTWQDHILFGLLDTDTRIAPVPTTQLMKKKRARRLKTKPLRASNSTARNSEI